MNKLINFFQQNLNCLKSGESLLLLDSNTELHVKLSKAFNNLFNKDVEYFMANKSLTLFYPVISNVIILVEGFYLDISGEICGEGKLDPFSIIEDNDADWYDNYDKIVDFKKKEILSIIEKTDIQKLNLVEHMSSTGVLISYLKDQLVGIFKNYIATDLDFYALKELSEKDPDIICICCDATTSVFKENTISIATSNSVHHVPDNTDNFYTNVYASLEFNGKYTGIESQGFLAKIVIYTISFMPKWLVPYAFKEIHTEQYLLKSWNSINLLNRLKIIPSTLIQTKKFLFHIGYSFTKTNE